MAAITLIFSLLVSVYKIPFCFRDKIEKKSTPQTPRKEVNFHGLQQKRRKDQEVKCAFLAGKQQNKLPSYRCIYKILVSIEFVGGKIKKIILPDLTGSYRRKLKIILPEIKTSYLIK